MLQYSLAYSRFITNLIQSAYHIKKKKSLFFNGDSNNCPWNCRKAKKNVSTIDLQATYESNVNTADCKANQRLLNDNHKTQERFERASHVATGNLSTNSTVRTPTTCM